MSGLFVTLEGIEGAGKSSAMAVVERYFTDRGRACVCTREPGGTELGEHIRRWLLDPATQAHVDTETLLVFAARAQHIAEVIRPALDQGQVVLCDRFTDATYAYQGVARGVHSGRIAVLEQWVQGSLRPDLTFLLDVPIATSARRVTHRGGERDRFERESIPFFERVREGYLERAAQDPQRIRVIDASCNQVEVARAITRTLAESHL